MTLRFDLDLTVSHGLERHTPLIPQKIAAFTSLTQKTINTSEYSNICLRHRKYLGEVQAYNTSELRSVFGGCTQYYITNLFLGLGDVTWPSPIPRYILYVYLLSRKDHQNRLIFHWTLIIGVQATGSRKYVNTECFFKTASSTKGAINIGTSYLKCEYISWWLLVRPEVQSM